MEKFEAIESNVPKLKMLLSNAGVDISIWGTGGFKTIEHLAKEIDNNEIILAENEQGELIRISEVVASSIYYIDDINKYRLKEQKQVFLDGRVRIRPSNGQSVFEKMKFGEDPTQAMIRGISEELGIDADINLKHINTVQDTADSKSYPGLQTKSTTHFFDVILNSEQFNPRGYTEEQSDKITYFVWEKID